MVAQAPPSSAPQSRRRLRPWGWALLALVVVAAVLAVWFLLSLRTVQPAATRLRAEVTTLQSQLRSADLQGAAGTMARLRSDAGTLRSTTSSPPWTVAAMLPGVGGDVSAVRTLSQVGADVADAAAPIETALPSLAPARLKASGGVIDTTALGQIARALPAVSQQVQQGTEALSAIDTSGLRPEIARGVEQVRGPLDGVKEPLASATRSAALIPTMLGAQGKRTYFVMLQQDAEARGTGGLMGAYAIITADKGKISLVETQPRGVLQDRPVPAATAGVPEELQYLWGSDLTEWAGLNLSPHFPWTGQLIAAGWAQRPGAPKLDGVIGIDGAVVQALLAGTGPVEGSGVRLTSANAAQVLAKDIYRQYPDPHQVDAATGALVQQIFAKVASGQVDVSALVGAMKGAYSERRVLMWSTHENEQIELGQLALSGSIPDAPGPFAMTVVNNGGGNKLDAYLKVTTRYEPGDCTDGVRIGSIAVDLTNTAPASGLPDYVSVRSDLKEKGLPNPVVGSTKVLVDVYSGAGTETPLSQLDGAVVEPVTRGADRGTPSPGCRSSSTPARPATSRSPWSTEASAPTSAPPTARPPSRR